MFARQNGPSKSSLGDTPEKENGSTYTPTTRQTSLILSSADLKENEDHLRNKYGIPTMFAEKEYIPPIEPWEYLTDEYPAEREGFWIELSYFLGGPSYRYVPNQIGYNTLYG